MISPENMPSERSFGSEDLAAQILRDSSVIRALGSPKKAGMRLLGDLLGQRNRYKEMNLSSRKSFYGYMRQILTKMELLILSSLFQTERALKEITGKNLSSVQDSQSMRDVNGELKKWI